MSYYCDMVTGEVSLVQLRAIWMTNHLLQCCDSVGWVLCNAVTFIDLDAIIARVIYLLSPMRGTLNRTHVICSVL